MARCSGPVPLLVRVTDCGALTLFVTPENVSMLAESCIPGCAVPEAYFATNTSLRGKISVAGVGEVHGICVTHHPHVILRIQLQVVSEIVAAAPQKCGEDQLRSRRLRRINF